MALIADLLRTSNRPELQSFAATLEHVVFDHCMHGRLRDKRTKLLSSPNLFTSLAVDCDRSHVHASWTPFKADNQVQHPTALEAEYPAVLCKRMAECVAQAAHDLGLIPVAHPRLKDLLTYNLVSQTIRHPPLIPEYREYAHLPQPIDQPSCKLLASPMQGAATETHVETDGAKQKHARVRTTYNGILRDPAEFLEQNLLSIVDSSHFLRGATLEANTRGGHH